MSEATTAVPSCRIDSFTGTFKAPTIERYESLLNFAYQVNGFLDESRPLRLQGKGKHFQQVFSGGGLVTVEGTPPTDADGSINQARNAGVVSITYPGKFFEALDVSERAQLLLDTARQEGFFHCTRLDAQLTQVDPAMTAQAVIEQVAAGKLWVLGFKTQRVYGNRDRDGNWVAGCTQYFGGKESDRQVRCYDKAAEQGWDRPAVRHELQLRGDCARDRFIQLRGALQRQQERDPLLQTAEQDFVKMALKQDLAYRDTARWAGRPKPKNWAQVAVEPNWWTEAVGSTVDSFSYSRRPKSTLDQAVEAFLDQYGPKVAEWVLKRALLDGEPVQEALQDLFLKMIERTGENATERIFQELPGADYGRVLEVVQRYQRFAADYREGEPKALARFLESPIGGE
jgi:hypothetical protein